MQSSVPTLDVVVNSLYYARGCRDFDLFFHVTYRSRIETVYMDAAMYEADDNYILRSKDPTFNFLHTLSYGIDGSYDGMHRLSFGGHGGFIVPSTRRAVLLLWNEKYPLHIAQCTEGVTDLGGGDEGRLAVLGVHFHRDGEIEQALFYDSISHKSTWRGSVVDTEPPRTMASVEAPLFDRIPPQFLPQ